MKKLFCFIYAIFIICFTGCMEEEEKINYNAPIITDNGTAVTPDYSSNLQGKNYQDVEKIFQGRGFTNIQTETVKKGWLDGWSYDEGDVKEVSIGGLTDYDRGQVVPANISVVIRYYSSSYNSSSDNSSSDNSSSQTSTESVPDMIGLTVEEVNETIKNSEIKIKEWVYKQSIIKNTKGDKNANSTYGSSFGSSPSNPKAWVVVDQSIAAGESAKDGVILTMDLKVLNTKNNTDFNTILNKDNSISEKFANEHRGELIEFTGVFIDLTQDSTYNFTFLIGGYDDQQSAITEFFCFKNTDVHAVKNAMEDTDKATPGNICHIVGFITGFDSKYGILLTPVGIDYIKKV